MIYHDDIRRQGQWGHSSTFQFRWGNREEGNCFSRYRGGFTLDRSDQKLDQILPGNTDCIRAHIVKNFFVGRTKKVSSIGFDNNFDRVGHIEFFMDGYFEGLQVGLCKHVNIGHQQCASDDWSYNARRFLTDEDKVYFHQDVLFRRNLKCYSEPM